MTKPANVQLHNSRQHIVPCPTERSNPLCRQDWYHSRVHPQAAATQSVMNSCSACTSGQQQHQVALCTSNNSMQYESIYIHMEVTSEDDDRSQCSQSRFSFDILKTTPVSDLRETMIQLVYIYFDWTEQGLTSYQTHYRSYRGRVFMGQMTQPTVSKH